MLGNFYAELRRAGKAQEIYFGRCDIGGRSDKDDRMAASTDDKMTAIEEINNLFVGNTLFRKKAERSWTWIALNPKNQE